MQATAPLVSIQIFDERDKQDFLQPSTGMQIDMLKKLSKTLIPQTLRTKIRQFLPFNSAEYWEERYQRGGTSGPGSYGKVAVHKANTLNDFVIKHDIESVIEFGFGDGHQLEIARYPKYLGLDVSRSAVDLCQKRFKQDETKSFFWYAPTYFSDPAGFIQADLAISLEVVFHLVEEDVFEQYLMQLFAAARRYVIIFSSNDEELQITNSDPHVRHRNFTRKVADLAPKWELEEVVENPFPKQCFSSFFIYRARSPDSGDS